MRTPEEKRAYDKAWHAKKRLDPTWVAQRTASKRAWKNKKRGIVNHVDERQAQIAAARRENSAISAQVGFDVSSLLVRPSARKPWQDFVNADEYENRNCLGREKEFVDYADDDIPIDGVARVLCDNCPVFQKCDAFATAEKPGWGVHGGKTYGRENVEKEE